MWSGFRKVLRVDCTGKGRLLNCLDKHDKQVSKRCKQAIKDVGLK